MSTLTAARKQSGKHFIAGQWQDPGNAVFESHNPAHWDQIVGVFPAASADLVNEAVAAAREAYPAWRRTSRLHRAELFDNLAQLVKRDVDQLAELMEIGRAHV